MIEVVTSLEDLSNAPEFDAVFEVWQQARDLSDGLEDQVAEHIADQHDGLNSAELGETVSYYLGMSLEEFESDYFPHDQATCCLNAGRFSALQTEDEVKSALLAMSEGLGVSQFALYGLWLHMRESGKVAKEHLIDAAQAAETDLAEVDNLVRNNPGEILTLIDVFGIYAGRLGVGGLTIVNNNRVQIPLADSTTAFGIARLRQDRSVNVYDNLSLEAHDIHSILRAREARLLENWGQVLNLDVLDEAPGAVLIVGKPQEGPAYISNGEEREYYEDLLSRIRLVGNATSLGLIT